MKFRLIPCKWEDSLSNPSLNFGKAAVDLSQIPRLRTLGRFAEDTRTFEQLKLLLVPFILRNPQKSGLAANTIAWKRYQRCRCESRCRHNAVNDCDRVQISSGNLSWANVRRLQGDMTIPSSLVRKSWSSFHKICKVEWQNEEELFESKHAQSIPLCKTLNWSISLACCLCLGLYILQIPFRHSE